MNLLNPFRTFLEYEAVIENDSKAAKRSLYWQAFSSKLSSTESMGWKNGFSGPLNHCSLTFKRSILLIWEYTVYRLYNMRKELSLGNFRTIFSKKFYSKWHWRNCTTALLLSKRFEHGPWFQTCQKKSFPSLTISNSSSLVVEFSVIGIPSSSNLSRTIIWIFKYFWLKICRIYLLSSMW